MNSALYPDINFFLAFLDICCTDTGSADTHAEGEGEWSKITTELYYCALAIVSN